MDTPPDGRVPGSEDSTDGVADPPVEPVHATTSEAKSVATIGVTRVAAGRWMERTLEAMVPGCYRDPPERAFVSLPGPSGSLSECQERRPAIVV